MGNFNTPGLVKLWWKNDIVDTKYQTIHQIPIITIDKRQSFIPPSGEKMIILHYDESQKSNQVLAKLENIQGSGVKIYAIPNQNSKQNFETIRKNNPQSLGKMTMNGTNSHPLFKHLKKNCPEFYNFETNSSKKNITSPIGIFVIKNSTDQTKNTVDYYSQEKLDKFLAGVQAK